MSIHSKRFIVVGFCVFVLALSHLGCAAAASGEITEVSVSPDLQRIAIKSEGPMGAHTALKTDRPPRLAIDIAATGVAKAPLVTGLAKGSSLGVRLVRTGAGARVTLDFGARTVPEYKILRMNNYLVLLLGKWASEQPSSAKAGPVKTAKRETISSSRQKETPSHAITDNPRLSIKSAEVIDNLIVLRVVNSADPERVFRIDLGVDFRQLGFSTANIYPLSTYAELADPGPRSDSNTRASHTRVKSIGPRQGNVSLLDRLSLKKKQQAGPLSGLGSSRWAPNKAATAGSMEGSFHGK